MRSCEKSCVGLFAHNKTRGYLRVPCPLLNKKIGLSSFFNFLSTTNMHSFIVIIVVLIALVACTQASQGSLRDLKKSKHGGKKIKKEKKIKKIKKKDNDDIEIKNEEADVQNLNEKKDKKKDNDDIEIKNEETAVQTLNEDECSSEYIPSKCECSKGPTCWNRIANSNEHETKCSQCLTS